VVLTREENTARKQANGGDLRQQFLHRRHLEKRLREDAATSKPFADIGASAPHKQWMNICWSSSPDASSVPRMMPGTDQHRNVDVR
jgi:hypothetical protein